MIRILINGYLCSEQIHITRTWIKTRKTAISIEASLVPPSSYYLPLDNPYSDF